LEATSKSLALFLGTVVRTLRRANGWSQERLAQEAKLYSHQISLLEGAKRTPTLPVMAQVAGAFGLECNQLVWMAEMLQRRVQREEAKMKE
jgi:transcriptional regulator with XRE-family HTH domain